MDYLVSVDFIVEANSEDEARMLVIELARQEAAIVAIHNVIADEA